MRITPTTLLDAQMSLADWWLTDSGIAVGHWIATGKFIAENQDAADVLIASAQTIKTESEALAVATPFWVSDEFVGVAAHAAQQMRPQPLSEFDLPCGAGFMWLAETLTVPGIEFAVRAIRWDSDRIGVDLTLYGDGAAHSDLWSNLSRPPLAFMLGHEMWRFGSDFTNPQAFDWSGRDLDTITPGEIEDRLSTGGYVFRFALAMWALMREPLAAVAVQDPDRKQRRRLQREGRETPEEGWGVRVVTLRRLATRETTPGDGTSSVEWSHRWVVSGHWKWQWHPRPLGTPCGHCDREDGFHRQKWIHPYPKGPKDKPLVLSKNVYALKR